MEIRQTIKTTPGRPMLAVGLMVALLAGTCGLAWLVTVDKDTAAIPLAAAVRLPGVGVSLAPPAGWSVGPVDPSKGLVGAFVEAKSGRPARDILVGHRYTGQPVDPATLLARFYQDNWQPDGRVANCRIGPFPARQFVVTVRVAVRGGDAFFKQIMRMAVLGADDSLVIQMTCSGPPALWEERVMDAVAGSAKAGGRYCDPNQLVGRTGIELAAEAGSWLADRTGMPAVGSPVDSADPADSADSADRPGSAILTLIPSVAPLDRANVAPATQPAGTGVANDFWGVVQMHIEPAGPNVNLPAKLMSGLGDGWPGLGSPAGMTPRLARSARSAAADWTPEKRTVGPLTVWRVRAAEGRTVRLEYVFRPPAPTANGAGQVCRVSAWAAIDDEAAATVAVERLVQAARIR